MASLPEKYRLIGVLCGLIGALGSNPKTEHTDAVFVNALSLFARLPEDAPPGTPQASLLRAGVAAIRREKYTIVPGCAVCQSPCANNADFDMQQILEAPAPEQTLKRTILTLLGQISTLLPASGGEALLTGDQLQLLMQAVSFLAWESDSGYLQAMQDLLQDLLHTLNAAAHKAPEPAAVP